MYLDFTFSYTQIQYSTGADPFTCWDVKDGFLITIISVATKF